MTRWSSTRTWWCIVACVSTVAVACGNGDRLRPVELGEEVPPYAALSLTGDTVSLEEYRGQVLLLNVWATWCHPCREEMPGLQRLHEQMVMDGLKVVGVSVDAAGSDEKVQSFLDDYGVTFEILRDPDDEITRTFWTIGVPETFLIGRDGRLRHHWIGRFDPLAEEVAMMVREALEDA